MMRLFLLLVLLPSVVEARNQPDLHLDAVPVRRELPRPDPRPTVPLLPLAEVIAHPETDVRDARLIKERLRRLYLDADLPKTEEVADWMKRLRADGSWAEFDYQTYHESFFPPFDHLKRVNGMALAYLKESPFSGDEALLDALVCAIEFWIDANPQTRHLWFVEIGVPLFLVKPLILLEEQLPPALMTRAFPLLTRAVGADDYIYNGSPATGANLTWIARTALEAALLTDNVPLAQQAAQRLADEIRVNPAEGIQADFGYYQHGTQFYAGGYGASFLHDAASAAALLDGTRYAIPDEKIRLLVDYVLEGPRWMTRHGSWVPGSRGREIARPGGRMAAAAVWRLLEVAAVPRRAELLAFAEELSAPRGAVAPTIQGNRHFWSVDLMTQHAPAWTAFIDLTSKRIFGTEGGNQENILGYHLVDGVVQIMRDGSEYHNIAPLWDWRKIPGATIRQDTEEIPFIDWWGDATRGTTAFVGGLSDGQRGMAVLDFDRNGIRVDKVWSVSDKWILAIGAGLSLSEGAEGPVVTTIDQRYRRGPVVIEVPGGERSVAIEGDTPLEGPVWIRHDGMGTCIPAGQRAVLRLDHRRESWERVNSGAQNPGLVEEAALLTLWLEHVSPADDPFHYSVWPDLPMDAPLPSPDAMPTVEVLDQRLVVVKDPIQEVVQVAAFQAGDWTIAGQALHLSAPCLLQIHPTASGGQLTVADPTALRRQLRLEIPRDWLPERLRGYYAGRHTVDFPQGELAGNSATVEMGVVPYVKAAAAVTSRGRNHLPLLDVASGHFRLGVEDGDADAGPAGEVYLSAFRIGEEEVTLAQWREIREWAVRNRYPDLPLGAPFGAVESAPAAGTRPVTRVNWYAVVRWCNALSERFGLEPVYYLDPAFREVYRVGVAPLTPAHIKPGADGYRLPTEAEWAFALQSRGPLLVGALNGVSEWCFDLYGPYSSTVRVDPAGPVEGFLRVRRGGVGGQGTQSGRAETRLPEAPTAGAGNIGFRVARNGLSLYGQERP